MQADTADCLPDGGTVRVIRNSQEADNVGRYRTASGSTELYLSDETLEKGGRYRVNRSRLDSRPSAERVIKLIEVEKV